MVHSSITSLVINEKYCMLEVFIFSENTQNKNTNEIKYNKNTRLSLL